VATSATDLELVSTVAHELRTPVAAVRGAVAALQSHGGELDAQSRERLLGVIADAAAQLGRLVDDLLATGRLETDRLPVDVRACDVFSVTDAAVAAARTHLPEGVSLRLEATAGLPQAAADPDRLRQVIENLVDNAVRHSPRGGTIEVRLEADDGRLTVAVADEGPGIPPAEHERVFERFYRGTSASPGLGLGLYLARELVDAMGGRIRVESEPGAGATFTVELPLAP
jgi:signal transduction histidine kinase